MVEAGQKTPETPVIPKPDIRSLRYTLIHEELTELAVASANEDIVEVADALGDLLVVVLGTAVAYGIDLEPIFWEIHRSNMTKFIDGHRGPNGKWIKGPSYEPALLGPLIKQQRGQIEDAQDN